MQTTVHVTVCGRRSEIPTHIKTLSHFENRSDITDKTE